MILKRPIQLIMEIERILKEKGLSKAALANMIGAQRQNINNLLTNPKLSTLEKIADALDVPVWQLLTPELEINGKEDETKITCPNCGKAINIKVEK